MEIAINLQVVSQDKTGNDRAINLEDCFRSLGITPDLKHLYDLLPFTGSDITAGSETELQAVVIGHRSRVDLPLSIQESRYFSNLQRRTRSGETNQRLLHELREFLDDADQQVWENSWVRFPRRCLSRYAENIFARDLLADKQQPQEGQRGDAGQFQLVGGDGESWLRVPVSYLIKLALADLIGHQWQQEPELNRTGETLLDHYLNDNSSPETFSFHVANLTPETGMGRELAKETAKRFLFTQLLIRYANLQFGLLETGQEAMVYFAPHPPLRQKQLNGIIPDAFYRQLFMSPCLSGWDRGEGKHRYMQLCHQVLSRSQLNAVAKLREAGIISNNLVILPNISNTSLANNGVHISLGSKRLTEACRADHGFGARHEKYLGDLSSKIMEHFLPLFVTTYSAAPYRLEFADFHPERALGFLPHELDFTHLRMFWRRWKKKASLSFFGHALTPFGPKGLDRSLSRAFRLRGDLVPDFRLIDYPVAFLSTEQSPAYNGLLGNQDLLKGDLADMGVFDRQMSLYQFFKLREHANMGFSGMEGRHYSLFPDLDRDLTGATNLQVLLCALAFKYMATGQVRHRHIPDTPFVESERRQIFFGMSIGIPTFYVQRNTRNRFLLKILKQTQKIRTSRRYPGYFRVYHQDYCQALLRVLREDAADLIEMFRFAPLLDDLEQRLNEPRTFSAAGRLIKAISAGPDNPLKTDAVEFNRSAEKHYRETLRRRHMEQALNLLREDLMQLEAGTHPSAGAQRSKLGMLLKQSSASEFLAVTRGDLLSDTLDKQSLVRLLNLMLLSEQHDRVLNRQRLGQESHGTDTPIYRAL
ncbi:MAG: hypothetical protein P1P74_05250 [Desulfuromonadales bacterium]|nr:hypothetical protein [Desulfuromonadales bacterium]